MRPYTLGVALVVVLSACGRSDSELTAREVAIVNGSASSDTSVVAIGARRTRCDEDFVVLCSGTVIEPDAVLTAAHCFQNTPTGTAFEVFVGDEVPNGSFVDVLDVQVNPAFDDATRANDTAILRTAEPLPGATLASLASETTLVDSGTSVEVGGFGTTSSNEPPDGIKRSGTTTIETIETDVITTGSGAITCQGDSGGPLFFNGEVLGVASSGDATCNINSIFSRVNAEDPFVTGALVATVAQRPSVVAACEETCDADAQCRPGQVCATQPTGDARCAFSGRQAGSFGASCDTDDDCTGNTCVRTSSSACACLLVCEGGVVTPNPPAGGGGCSVSWYRR